jgi:hypothetical protein
VKPQGIEATSLLAAAYLPQGTPHTPYSGGISTKSWLRTTSKWCLRVGILLVVLVMAVVTILAFPSPLFAHKRSFGEFTIYAQQPISDEFTQTIANVRTRIEAMEHPRPGAGCEVFLCDNQRLYTFFSFLTRRSANSLAIGLSVFGHVFVNEQKVQRFAAQNYHDIRHSRYEGNLAEVIAHEIVHFNMVKVLGYRGAIKLPVWKSEGYAEYQANLAATRADSSYDFAARIDLWQDPAVWGGNQTLARRLFLWHLLVEYLAEVKGYGLEALAGESLTEETVREQMLTWYQNNNIHLVPE